jgi:hypothetical protein
MSLRFDNQYKQKLWDLLGDKFLDSWNESEYQFCYDETNDSDEIINLLDPRNYKS